MAAKILAFAGSTRSASYNKLLVKIALKGATAAGAEVVYVDLKDYPIALFDEDVEKEQGMPEAARNLKKVMMGCRGFLIASPEYNGSFTPLMKNTLDWMTRKGGEGLEGNPFAGKFAGIMSASPGALGGYRNLIPLRLLMGTLSLTTIPQQVSISGAMNEFTPEGQLKDDKKQKSVENIGAELAKLVLKVNG